jgi:hypothetical protein
MFSNQIISLSLSAESAVPGAITYGFETLTFASEGSRGGTFKNHALQVAKAAIRNGELEFQVRLDLTRLDLVASPGKDNQGRQVHRHASTWIKADYLPSVEDRRLIRAKAEGKVTAPVYFNLTGGELVFLVNEVPTDTEQDGIKYDSRYDISTIYLDGAEYSLTTNVPACNYAQIGSLADLIATRKPAAAGSPFEKQAAAK